jgi:hypothetical protein
MKCNIKQDDIDTPRQRYPDVKLNVNSHSWESIDNKFNDFCKSKSIKTVGILVHHVVLRSLSDEKLPLLSNKNNHQQGEWTLFIVGCNVYVSLVQDLIYAIRLDVYLKSILSSKQPKQMLSEEIVTEFLFIFIKMLLVYLLYFRLILANMESNTQRPTAII